MSFNRVQIFGYLGRDPELKYTPEGTAVCKVSVATTEKRKRGGDSQDLTTWFRCTAWGKTAELISQHFSKGAPIFIEGKMHIEEYTDREGVQRYSVEVNVSSFEFTGKSSGEAAEAKPKEKAGITADAPNDDDIPF